MALNFFPFEFGLRHSDSVQAFSSDDTIRFQEVSAAPPKHKDDRLFLICPATAKRGLTLRHGIFIYFHKRKLKP